MTLDLEALTVAAYVFADEYAIPSRPGRPSLASDAELVALAMAQAAVSISSDRQFLGLVQRILPGWFLHIPERSQYNRRLRGLVELMSHVKQRLARFLDAGGARLADGTAVAVASYPGCEKRNHFAGFARYGYAKSQHRYLFGVRHVGEKRVTSGRTRADAKTPDKKPPGSHAGATAWESCRRETPELRLHHAATPTDDLASEFRDVPRDWPNG